MGFLRAQFGDLEPLELGVQRADSSARAQPLAPCRECCKIPSVTSTFYFLPEQRLLP